MFRLLFAALLVSAGGLLGCQPETPELIQVFDLMPSEVETNDTLTLRGAGFPPGEACALRFEGTVYRAASEPGEDFVLETEARSASDDRVELVLTDALVRAFTDTEEEPRHATFRGQVRLSFAPNLKGAPPIHGSGNVSVDVFPPKGESELAAAERELNEFLGAELVRAPEGVRVRSLVPEGRLARAGVRSQDLILRFSGLTVHTPLDLTPHAGQRSATLEVKAESAAVSSAPALTALDVEGFRPQQARRFRWGLALVVALSAWLLLGQTGAAHALGWLRVRFTRRTAEQSETWSLLAAKRNSERLPPSLAPFLLSSATFTALYLDLLPPLLDLDLVLLYCSIAALELMATLLGGGYHRHSWSLWRGLVALFKSTPLHLAIALGLFAVVLQNGTLGLHALAEHPDASPSSFRIFESPGSALTGASLLFVAFVQSLGFVTERRRKESASFFREFFQLTASLLLLGLLIALFFGGWATPGWLGHSRAAAAIWFQSKLTLGFIGLLLFKRALRGIPSRHLSALHTKLTLPATLLAVLLTPVWVADVWPDWLRQSVRLALMLGALLAVASIGVSALRSRRFAPPATASVNPWL